MIARIFRVMAINAFCDFIRLANALNFFPRKARKEDIPKALKKVNTFRINFPEYQHHKIYLAMFIRALLSDFPRAVFYNHIVYFGVNAILVFISGKRFFKERIV